MPQVGFLTRRAAALPRAEVGSHPERAGPRWGPHSEAPGEPEGGGDADRDGLLARSSQIVQLPQPLLLLVVL